MTNDEIRNNDETRRTKPATALLRAFRHSGFGFLSSFVIQRLILIRFLVTMHAQKRKESTHLPMNGTVSMNRREFAGFPSRFRCEAQYDVEFSGQFADSGAFERREIDSDRIPCRGVFDARIDAVASVLRLAFDVTLCGPLVSSLHFDGEMNVAGAPGIEHRFDGAEIVFAR